MLILWGYVMQSKAEMLDEIVESTMPEREHFGLDPQPEDLLRFRQGMKTKRLRKKFREHPHRYVRADIMYEYGIKRVGAAAAGLIRATMQREGFARRLFTIEEK